MRAALALTLLLGLAGCGDKADGQTADETLAGAANLIEGQVLDEETGDPVAGARVVLDDGSQTVDTDEAGLFSFARVSQGAHGLVASKHGYFDVSTTVVTGIEDAVMRLPRDPATFPFWTMTEHRGHMACGLSILFTSIGCNTFEATATATGGASAWPHLFERQDVRWTQGELVWDPSPTAGMLAWEIAPPGNEYYTREVSTSPALVYLTDSFFASGDVDLTSLQYRFYGGPHPACQLTQFGCGLTALQDATAYIHDFYGVVPPADWRYTNDGDPVPPS